MAKILIIDRDKYFEILVGAWLEREGHEIRVDPDLEMGLETIEEVQPDVVIIGLPLHETESTDQLVEEYIARSVAYKVIITMNAITSQPVACTRVSSFIEMGASDFFTKPMVVNGKFMDEEKLRERVVTSVSRALNSLHKESSLTEHFNRKNIIGKSSLLLSCLADLEKAAKTHYPILIMGETGTGKELFAKAAHENSPRSGRPFLPLNCAALPEQLAESELFGYKKGAHATAYEDKDGLVKQAHRGTLFLDEIGDLPLSIQTKLLRCLQEKSFLPLGASIPEPSDFRLISATNQNLEEKAKKGEFRTDLYFRINARIILLPPLRDRREDIRELAEPLIREAFKVQGLQFREPTQEFMHALEMYDWPGNVRELQSMIGSAVSNAGGVETLGPYHLPAKLLGLWLAYEGHRVMHPLSEEEELEWIRQQAVQTVGTMDKEGQSSSVNADLEKEVGMSFDPPSEESIDPSSSSSSGPTGEIGPENIVAGEMKWKKIMKLQYHARVALIVAARSIWEKPKRELAELLDVHQNAFEQFFSTAKKKVQKGDLDVEDLKPYVSVQYHPALEEFLAKTPARKPLIS